MGLIDRLIGSSHGQVLIGIKTGNKFRHIPVLSEEQAISIGQKYAANADVYVSCAKHSSSGGRTKDAAASVNAFWLDIDCGDGKPYANKKEACYAVDAFCKSSGLLKPTHVIDSGNGLHVYWVLDHALSPMEWKQTADILKNLTHAYDLKADDSRTSDIASVLRLPGTLNHKDPNNPKPVVSKYESEPISAQLFIDRIHDASKGFGHSKSEKMSPLSGFVSKILEYMENNEPRLHSGEWQHCETDLGVVGYPSHSEADYAYLGKCVRKALALDIGRDEVHDIVLNTFQKCALYREEKLHAINTSIEKLLNEIPNKTAQDQESKFPGKLDLNAGVVELTDELPKPRDWVVGGLLLAGKSAILGGAGGVSKTQLALQVMSSIGLGLSVCGRSTTAGKAIAILGEDDAEECARRINAHVKTLQLSAQQKSQLQDSVRVFPMIGEDTRFTKPYNGVLESTGLAESIIKVCREFQDTDDIPVRLIVIDHVGLIHGGDFNAREDAVQTMRLVNFIAQETGAAVLLLAHTSKSAARKDDEAAAEDIAGNAAWVDLTRSVVMLRTMTEAEGRKLGITPENRKQYASLNVVKSNYAPMGETIWLVRRSVDGYGVGVLDHVDLQPPVKAVATAGADIKLRERIIELVQEKHCLTKNKIAGYAGKDKVLKASKAAVQAEIDAMLADGSLYLVQPSDDERKKIGLNANTSGFLRTTRGVK